MRYGLLNDIRPLDKRALYKTVERFLFLGLEDKGSVIKNISYPKLEYRLENAKQAFERLSEKWPADKILGICPGAEYGPAKRWPPEYFVEVAQACRHRGWNIWLFGSDKDRPITDEIESSLVGNCVNLAGRTSLTEAIDLMSACNVVLTNDSGLMHVAAAVGTKVVAIFGSSDPEHTPPLSDKATIQYLSLECSPCFDRECKLGHTDCLKQLRPENVIQSVLRM
jgi:heptosyltransferase-2